MTDNAGAHDLRRRINDAGDHSVERQIVRDNSAWIDAFQAGALIGTSMLEEVPPRNPILHGEHRGLRTHDRGKVAYYRRNLVRLHAEDNQVLLADAGDTITRRYARNDLLAFFQQRKTVLDNAHQMRAAGNDAHILTRMGKFGKKKNLLLG